MKERIEGLLSINIKVPFFAVHLNGNQITNEA